MSRSQADDADVYRGHRCRQLSQKSYILTSVLCFQRSLLDSSDAENIQKPNAKLYKYRMTDERSRDTKSQIMDFR